MPRIPVHTAGNLASARTGVPARDQSGEIIAGAFTNLATKAANVIEESLTKQQALLKKAELSKKVSQFDSDMMVSSAEIRQQYLSDPDEGVKQLQIRRQELFGQYKEGIDDQEVKLAFDAFGTETMVKGQAFDQIWAFGENNKIIQQTHFDRMASDSTFAGQTDSLDEVIQKAALLDADREDFYQAWGGVREGTKVIDAGQESMVKSYFYGQLSKGNAFKVLKEIEDQRFGPMDGTNGLIDVQELKTMKAQATSAATAGKADAAAFALVDSVQTNFDIDKALAQPISATEEQINTLSFSIAQKKELEALGQVDPAEIKTLESQQKLLEKVRAAQLSRNEMYIIPDPVVDAEMGARFLGLFKKGKGLKPFKATLEEVFQFQQDLLDNRNRITPSAFKKLNLMTEGAFQGEINGFMKGSKLKTEEKFFGKELKPTEPKRLSTSKKMQNVFSDIIAKHDPEAGNAELFEQLQFFYDDLSEVLDLDDGPSLEAVSQETLNDIATNAQRKVQFRKLGLPVYTRQKDVIYRGGAPYIITGFATDGVPMVSDL